MRERLDGEAVCGVKVEIFFEAVGVEEIIADPSGGERGEVARVEVELDAFAGAEDGEAVVGGGEEAADVAVAGVVAGGARVGAAGAALSVGIERVAGGGEARFFREAEEGQGGGGERD